jgi:hypothetical protein
MPMPNVLVGGGCSPPLFNNGSARVGGGCMMREGDWLREREMSERERECDWVRERDKLFL